MAGSSTDRQGKRLQKRSTSVKRDEKLKRKQNLSFDGNGGRRGKILKIDDENAETVDVKVLHGFCFCY